RIRETDSARIDGHAQLSPPVPVDGSVADCHARGCSARRVDYCGPRPGRCAGRQCPSPCGVAQRSQAPRPAATGPERFLGDAARPSGPSAQARSRLASRGFGYADTAVGCPGTLSLLAGAFVGGGPPPCRVCRRLAQAAGGREGFARAGVGAPPASDGAERTQGPVTREAEGRGRPPARGTAAAPARGHAADAATRPTDPSE